MSSKLLQRTMRAIQVENFGGPEVLKLKSILNLPSLTSTQVLVKVTYTGVNPVETYIRQGTYTRLPSLPYVPGEDASGIVESLGSDVKGFSKGNKVFVTGKHTGSYAEYIVVDQDYVFPLFERLSLAQGAALGVPYFTAYRALIMGANARPGESVLVHGASGAVGTAAVQIARSMGMRVFGTAGTKEGMDVVVKCGAHHAFNHRDGSYIRDMKDTTDSGGFDVIIENLSNVNLEKDMQMLKRGGRVMIVGCRGSININPRHLMAPEASIRGVALGTASIDEYKEMGSAIVGGIEAGWINPVIDREYSLEEADKAHHDIIHSKGAKGKLVLKV